MAAVLLAVELLLFEWKPRSLIPVALASAVGGRAAAVPARRRRRSSRCRRTRDLPVGAAVCRGRRPAWRAAVAAADAGGLRGGGPVPAAADPLDVVAGDRRPGRRHRRLTSSRARWASATTSSSDLLQRRISSSHAHWSRLLIVKAVDLVDRAGLGHVRRRAGAAADHGRRAGALASPFLPGGDPALWPLVSMAAVLGGTMRSPLTGVVFALELTHDIDTPCRRC